MENYKTPEVIELIRESVQGDLTELQAVADDIETNEDLTNHTFKIQNNKKVRRRDMRVPVPGPNWTVTTKPSKNSEQRVIRNQVKSISYVLL